MPRPHLVLLFLLPDGVRADAGRPRSPLVHAAAASEKPEVNRLNTFEAGRLDKLCFDEARTVCMCRVPAAIAKQITGGRHGEPLWSVDGSVLGTGATKTVGARRVPTPLHVALHSPGESPHLPAYALADALAHRVHRYWACAQGHAGLCNQLFVTPHPS